MCFNSIAIIQNEGLLYRARLSSNAADLEKSLGKRFLVFIFCENLLFLSTCRGYNVGRFDGQTLEDRVDFRALATPEVSSDAADVASVGPTRSDLVPEPEPSSSLVFPRIPPSPQPIGRDGTSGQYAIAVEDGLVNCYNKSPIWKRELKNLLERPKRLKQKLLGQKKNASRETRAAGLRKELELSMAQVFSLQVNLDEAIQREKSFKAVAVDYSVPLVDRPEGSDSQSNCSNCLVSFGFNKICLKVPQQKNEYDCGLFVLYFMKKIIEDTPERFRRKYLSMFGSKWFKSEEASGLRKQIQGLVLEVFGSAMTENDKAESPCCHESPEDDCLQ
ncbi:hypothetical protein ZIOFF_042502 [Zingiber officinale]|uniref:Ubiquitin-like protease family profile domain-containing protein n=1 Tax=Zingiber officinale TaxID=94328 RepID=A0A8J5KYU8_ZINOF|nr:hypothetical protein ZIOFF_042502 [Zingiber officinale]